MNDYKIISPPTAEPISLTEAKLHLRVDHTDDDALITSLIKTAREYCERFQRRTYMATAYQMKLDTWQDVLRLPLPPLWRISSITYVDSAGDVQTLGTTVYEIDTHAEPGEVRLDYNQSWPAHRSDHHAITVNYTCGYSTTFTAAATDTCTPSGRVFTDTQRVRVHNKDGTLPTGLSADTDYYIISAAATTFELSATLAGAAVDITSTGTGTHYIGEVPQSAITAMKLLISHLYEHREAVSEYTLKEVPMAVESYLWIELIKTF